MKVITKKQERNKIEDLILVRRKDGKEWKEESRGLFMGKNC